MRPAVVLLVSFAVLVSPVPAFAVPAPVGATVVSWWRALDDATDAVGTNDGVLLGGATFADGLVGRSFSLDGVDDAVAFPDDPQLYPQGSFALDAWIRTSQPTGNHVIASHYECGNACPSNSAASTVSLYLINGVLEGTVRDSDQGGPDSGGQSVLGAHPVADSAFHHVALVRDVAAATLTVYVDGQVDAQEPLGAGASGPLGNDDGSSDLFYIGAVPNAGDATLRDFFTGLIDEVTYWDRAVSAAEITAIHAAGAEGKTRDTTAPESTATAPLTSTTTAITVGWTATDPLPGGDQTQRSGLLRVELWAKGPSETGFARVAEQSSSDTSGSFSYAAGGPGSYSFVTVAVDRAGNRESLPVAADATTIVSLPAPPPAATSKPVASVAPKAVAITQIATLPSAKACVSRRTFPIRLRGIKQNKIVRAQIKLNGTQVRSIKGKALGLPVDLRGLPKGRFTVEIVTTDAAGKRVIGKRTYRTCAPKRR